MLRENEEVTLRLTRGEIVIPPVESGDAATMLKDSTVPEGEIGLPFFARLLRGSSRRVYFSI